MLIIRYFATCFLMLLGPASGMLQLNMTMMNRNENLSIPLLNYFNYSLEYPTFMIDESQSTENIRSYFKLPILPQLQNITELEMTSKSNISLGSRNVIRTLTLQTQPIKILLAENGLLFLAKFDDKMDGRQTNQLQALNISAYFQKPVNCTDFALDPGQSMLYVQCYDRTNNNYNVKVFLIKDINAIVDNMTVVGSRSTVGSKNISLKCKERKIIYIDNAQFGKDYVKSSILIYCPYSKRQGSTLKAMAYSSALVNQTVQAVNFSSCPTSCCFQCEIIQWYNDQLIMVTAKDIYRYASASSILSFEDKFRFLHVGAVGFAKDLFVVTVNYLYIKYSSLANVKVIEIGEDGLYPQGFAVTKHYIYLQMGNDSISKLKIFRILSTLPKLVLEEALPANQVVSDTGNYYAYADYFYLFDGYNNNLLMVYYRGSVLSIKYNFVYPTLASTNYLVCVTNKNESMLIQLKVWPYDSKEVLIDYSQLHSDFESKIININLRSHIKGPLIDFQPVQLLEGGDYITGLTLIDLKEPFLNDDVLQNMLGIRFEEDIEGARVVFIFRSNQTIFFLTCSLGYSSIEKRVVPVDCNHYLSVIIEQKFIKLEELQRLQIIAGLNQTLYLLYDQHNIVLCSQQNVCYQKFHANRPTSLIQKIRMSNTPRPQLLLLSYDTQLQNRTLRVFDLGILQESNTQMELQLEIGRDKIAELGDPNVIIKDFHSDFDHSDIIAILTNTSRLYIVQRELINGSLPYLCHVTYVLNCSAIDRCLSFNSFFLLSEAGRQKIVLLTTEGDVPKGSPSSPPRQTIYEHIIENPFNIWQAREYPLLDYTILQSLEPFTDNHYLYVGVSRQNQSYYLIYDSKEASDNILLYRIPAQKKARVLIAQFNNEIVHPGLGLIGNYLYSVSNYTFVAKLEEQFNRSIALAIKNDNNQLLLFDYVVTVNLASSKIDYAGEIPRLQFSSQNTSMQLVVSLDQLSGPIEDIDITERCDAFDITRTDLIQPDRCIGYYNKQYGDLVSFSALGLLAGQEVALTTSYLLCVKESKVVKKILWPNNCTFREFSQQLLDNETQQLILLCMEEDANFMHLLQVDSYCNMTVSELILTLDSEIRYYDIQASFPYLIVEAPILFPQNKNYFICRFDTKDRVVNNCASLVKGRQDTFLSQDFDLRLRYVLILQKGIGIYDLKNLSKNSLDISRWITIAELAQIGIEGSFSYLQIVSFWSTGFTFEIGTMEESFQVLLQGDNSMQIMYHYNKYINCQYSRDSKSKYFDDFVIRTCREKQLVNYLMAGLLPVYSNLPRKYVQVYLRSNGENLIGWPISMVPIEVYQDFAISGNYLVINSVSNLLCYYKLNNEIRWKINFVDTDSKEQCNQSISVYNDLDSKNYELVLHIRQDTLMSDSWMSMYSIHIVLGCICLFSTFFIWREMVWQMKHRIRKQRVLKKRKSMTKINFFSNEFEINLRKIESMKRIK